LLILGLTLGASYGWVTASFLAPFLLSVVLFPFFFWWETRVPEAHALLPPAIWRLPNVPVLVAFALITVSSMIQSKLCINTYVTITPTSFVEAAHVLSTPEMARP
jgi:hypothetical protein